MKINERLKEYNIMNIYGYCRISTKKQSIERQIRNIKEYNESALILQEAYTGTKVQGRKEFEKLLKVVKEGDTIIFDSVSRMSRNADEGVKQYFELYERGINLVFLKERHIDTESYEKAIKESGIVISTDNTAEGELIQDITKALNKFMRAKVKCDIVKAFEQAEKEVKDLHERTKEGIKTARLNGKQIGRAEGAKVTTKKSITAKEQIIKYSKDFQGSLSDADVIKLIGINRNTYYKYKREIREN